MSHPLLARWSLLFVLFLAVPALSRAQDAAVRKIVLPSLDSQVAARLVALDRRLNPVHSPELAASVMARLALPGIALPAFTPILSDARNSEVWERLPLDYIRMIQESGDALVTLPSAGPRLGVAASSEQVRRLCQERLAGLPRASLETYRQRVEAEASALLEEGQRTRSPLPLRRLVDDLLCSRHGPTGLDLLGDLAFERGDFDEARHWWARTPSWATTAASRLAAKRALALIFAGRLRDAKTEIERFRERYPNAKGEFAGHKDLYATTLEKVLADAVRERIGNNEEPWTTFGGDATRNRTLSYALHWGLWDDGPAWRVPLPTLAAMGKEPPTDRGSLVRRLAFHPIIIKDQVLIADHRSVISYHLTTGKELFRYALPNVAPTLDPTVTMPRFTLSADRERAYVRLGAAGIGPKTDGASWLVCLDLTEPERKKPRELWRIEAKGDGKSFAYFEGSPLVCEGRVYAALSLLTGQRVETAIVCYDTLGRHRWTRWVCDCPEFEERNNGPRYRQHLLTWAGGQIVYASHSGAIVAVDSATGQPTWGARYPSRGPLTADAESSPRDLTPCVYHDGCVFAAPLDSDRVFCIDAVSGQVRWETESVEVLHLLGAADGRLLATTRNGVIAIRIATGLIDWLQPSEGHLPSMGRGLIAGRWLFWPTQDPQLPYRALALGSGRQQQTKKCVVPDTEVFDPAMLASLPPGNMVFGHGCLAIAGLRELVVYAPGHRQLPPGDIRPQARAKAGLRALGAE
jgi:outer membrane protein assembly factor BamB